jgi:hypothetical protein
MLSMPNDKYGCEWDEHRWSRSGFCLDCGEEGDYDPDVPIEDYRQDLIDSGDMLDDSRIPKYIPEDE